MTRREDVLVFSIALGDYAELFGPCLASQRQYCADHGYDYVVVRHGFPGTRPEHAAWSKLYLLRAAMRTRYRWVAFLDADCEVRPHAPGFAETFDGRQAEVFMAEGFSGRLNTGVILMRVSTAGEAYLDGILRHAGQRLPAGVDQQWEGAHVRQYGDAEAVEVIDSTWNDNRGLHPDSYVQHYSGQQLRSWYLQNLAPPGSEDSVHPARRHKVRGEELVAGAMGLTQLALREHPQFQPAS